MITLNGLAPRRFFPELCYAPDLSWPSCGVKNSYYTP